MKKIQLSGMTLGTFSICILALLSTIFSLYSTSQLKNQINLMYENTYKVRNEAESISSRMSEIRMTLPTLLENDNTNQMAHITDVLTKRDKHQDDSIEIIRSNYLGSEEDVDNLVSAFKDLREARLVAVQLFSNKNELTQILQYFNNEVDPFQSSVNEVLIRIEATADQHIEATRKEAVNTQRVASTGAILLCLSIIVLVIVTTRSEQRKNREIAYREQMFDLLSHTIEDVFFIYSAANRDFDYVSKNCENILGISTEEFYKDPWALRECMVDGSKEIFDDLIKSGKLDKAEECDLKILNNNMKQELKLRIYPVAKKGKIKRYVAVMSDQTKVIEHQNVLNDALLSAQRANAAKRDFLSRMSHEIRTPMNTIIGMTTIALRHVDDVSHVENCLKKITFSSGHLLSLINDILDMSKIDDNKLSINHELFDFKKLMESMTSIVYPQTIEREQEFEVSIFGLTEEMLVGDALRLNQILLNILSNAVKFTPKGGRIELGITKVKKKKNKMLLRFTISDTGIGMNEEFMSRLFTPFEQADGLISQKYGGTGLGMSITKNLVSLMNGTITVDSRLNEGTTFTVELPFEAAEGEAVIYNQELTELNVLVVDDDKNTCDHAMVLMEQIGIKASWVCSGKEAVEKVIDAHHRGDEYDVCFIDWCMPEMDGIETAKQIRHQLGPDAIIIIISAYDWSLIEKEARDVGVNAFVSKPIFASSICDTLNSIFLPKPMQSGVRAEGYHFEGEKVLLAEDNQINQEIAVYLLNEVGITVDSVENGKEALDKFENSDVDEYSLILMDIQMPVMNGYDSARAIRKSNHQRAASIPIIAMTANAFNEDIISAKEAGMDDHIAKPVDVNILHAMMEMYLNRE